MGIVGNIFIDFTETFFDCREDLQEDCFLVCKLIRDDKGQVALFLVEGLSYVVKSSMLFILIDYRVYEIVTPCVCVNRSR